ncbi:MAG: DUF349 domain-containing protein [Muribaculaceae bacterium]|nr:DUF349 domain-containing protein [Muribaculaceae bacterium]
METPIQQLNLVNDDAGSTLNHDAAASEVREPKPELTKSEVLEKLQAIAESAPEEISRDEVAMLKQVFYSIRRRETEAERIAYTEAGNDPATFAATPDPTEETLKETLNIIKEKKALLAARTEAEREANLARKTALIEEITQLGNDTDNVNRNFPRFREIQQEFKNTGEVPPQNVTDIWKLYQDAVERFYDQLKVNKDLRDYDFRKNLEQKELIIDQAEKLTGETDVITAFRRLQELHDKWREIGPVAKEVREEVWGRFKDASAIINKKYQTYFEERKQAELANETAKRSIIEELNAMSTESLASHTAWENATKVILDAQVRWKKVGFASKKVNNELYDTFRAICDKFFEQKAAYFKAVKDDLDENLRKKTAICEKAEQLAESTDWRAASDALINLQKEWKTIGTVPKRFSDPIWKRFRKACDLFFDRKKNALNGARQQEQENLRAKRELTESLAAIPDGTERQEVLKAIRTAQEQWNAIGHVPFSEKDKLYDAFRAAINKLYERFDLRENRSRAANFEASVAEMAGDGNKLMRERDRLMRAFEARKSELATCENNLGFFSSKSKSGDSMLREMNRRIARLREDIASIEQKINVIDSHL